MRKSIFTARQEWTPAYARVTKAIIRREIRAGSVSDGGYRDAFATELHGIRREIRAGSVSDGRQRDAFATELHGKEKQRDTFATDEHGIRMEKRGRILV